MQIYLVEVEVFDAAQGLLRTERYSQAPGWVSPAGDAYHTRLLTPGSFERHMFDAGRIAGSSSVGFGAIELANADGGLDGYYEDWAVDGRSVTIRRGDHLSDSIDGFDVLFTGTMAGSDLTWDMVQLQLLTVKGQVASLVLNEATFAGTGTVEGSASNLKDQNKQVVLGTRRTVECQLVDPAKRIFLVTDKPVRAGVGLVQAVSLSNMRDRGSPITAGGTVASVAAFQTNSPGGGTYDWYDGTDGTYFQLGSAPTGIVTVDITEGDSASDRTVAQIARRILLHMGIADSAILGVAALDQLQTGEAGVRAGGGPLPAGEALDYVLGGAGASWRDTRAGEIFLERLELPAAANAVLTLDRAEIVDVTILGGRSIPDWRVTAAYHEAGRVLSPDELAGIIGSDLATVAALGQAAREEEAEDTDLRVAHPLATEVEISTAFDSQTVAAAEAVRQLRLRRASRVVQIGLRDPELLFGTVDLGDSVILAVDRFGWGDGRAMRVIGLTESYGSASSAAAGTLILWG